MIFRYLCRYKAQIDVFRMSDSNNRYEYVRGGRISQQSTRNVLPGMIYLVGSYELLVRGRIFSNLKKMTTTGTKCLSLLVSQVVPWAVGLPTYTCLVKRSCMLRLIHEHILAAR